MWETRQRFPATRSRGGITKTGNGHVRRVLVEAAWTNRHPARKSSLLQRRAEQTPEAVQAIAWEAQKRLCARYRMHEARGKLQVQTCTAIARELTGYIWAIGQILPLPPRQGVGAGRAVAVCRQQIGQRWENPRRLYGASGK